MKRHLIYLVPVVGMARAVTEITRRLPREPYLGCLSNEELDRRTRGG